MFICRKIYERAGACRTHLRRPHANLDIVLASTIENQPAYVLGDWGTDQSDANKPIEHGASDHASDPVGDTASSEAEAPDDTLSREPEKEVLKDNTYPVAAAQQDELGPHEAIREVKEYNEECSDLCETPWALFASAQGFKLEFSCIESKISKTRIKNYFSNDMETQHLSAVALCIPWRIFSDTWIPIARICNGWRDMWRTVIEHYSSSIGMAYTA